MNDEQLGIEFLIVGRRFIAIRRRVDLGGMELRSHRLTIENLRVWERLILIGRRIDVV
jgi:hypothetical protein